MIPCVFFVMSVRMMHKSLLPDVCISQILTYLHPHEWIRYDSPPSILKQSIIDLSKKLDADLFFKRCEDGSIQIKMREVYRFNSYSAWLVFIGLKVGAFSDAMIEEDARKPFDIDWLKYWIGKQRVERHRMQREDLR